MLDLILDDRAFLGMLLAFAVATPLAGWAAVSRSWIARRRVAVALGASGPVALAIWGLQNAAMRVLGFASVWTLLAMVGGCAILGAAAGIWICGERSDRTSNDNGA